MMHLYGKCDMVDKAEIFYNMTRYFCGYLLAIVLTIARTVESYNIMMGILRSQALFDRVLDLFYEMKYLIVSMQFEIL